MSVTAFRNVDVLSMKDETTARNQTVLVDGETITAIGPAEQVAVPAGARVIDGAGKTLIPGLFDMHIHVVPHVVMPRDGEDALETSLDMAGEYMGLFVAHGVTSVRNQNGTPLILKVREAIRSGRYPGPTITTAGQTVEQVFMPRSMTYRAHIPTPEAAVSVINAQADAGYDSVKCYNNISKEVFAAVMFAAHSRGMKVAGHIPIPVGLIGAMEMGLDCVEHMRGFDSILDVRPLYDRKASWPGEFYPGWRFTNDEKIAALADRVAGYPTWHAVTMLVEDPGHSDIDYPQAVTDAMPWSVRQHIEGLRNEYPYTPEQRAAIDEVRSNRRKMLKALDDRDVGIMTASDCPGASRRLIPGYSLLEEIEVFVASGISPYRALRAATIQPARYLGVDHERGTIEVGKRADMVLLDADPLADISNIHGQSGTMLGGAWYATGADRTAEVLAWRNDPNVNVARRDHSAGAIQWGKHAGPPLNKAAAAASSAQ